MTDAQTPKKRNRIGWTGRWRTHGKVVIVNLIVDEDAVGDLIRQAYDREDHRAIAGPLTVTVMKDDPPWHRPDQH